MKVCKICKKNLPENFFYTIKQGKYRLNRCSKCLSKRSVALIMKKRKIKFSREWFKRRFDRLKRNARDRNKKFYLTFEDFCKIRTYKNEKCFYCNSTTNIPFSIERLNNKIGYTVQNCVVACWRCNKMKSKDYTSKEMKILGRTLRKIDIMRRK